MNRNSLIILAAITLTMVVTAVVVVSEERSPTSMSNEKLLPMLSENINNATAITIGSNRYRTELERDGDTWRIANSDGYPALFDKVRSLLINLTELRTKERKTDNPELYHYLDVQETDVRDSNSTRVTVRNSDGEVLADVLLGKARKSKVTGLQTGLYVRKPDAEHALLVEGQAPVSAKKTDWFNTDTINISSDRVHEVIVKHPNGSRVRAYRDSPEGNFELDNLPADRRIQSRVALNKFGSVLQQLAARDIRALDQFDFGGDAVETRVQTYDGLVVNVKSTEIDGDHYANFQVRHDESLRMDFASTVTDSEGNKIEVAKQAEALQRRLSNWVYQIPGFKYDVLSATLDDYTRRVKTD